MIEYQAGVSLKLLCTIKGSVFPKALAWSVPASVCAALLNWFLLEENEAPLLLDVRGMHILWSSYSFVLGFLVVFRNGQAYSRFWEGAELIHQVRGEWINAMSSLIAFCNTDEDRSYEVAKFQHCAVRMMSMLHCAALQQIAEVSDHSFEILDPTGIDPDRLNFLSELHPVERCQVLLQWLQRLIIDADDAKTLKVAPPILSRVYQELSRGIVNLDNVAKIKQVPFPFPYAQMIAAMMIVHWIITPILASQAIHSAFWASFMTFITLSAFWSLFYIANEIEQPFGKDANDLPVSDMQAEMNHSLTLLLRYEVQAAPHFEFHHENHSKLFRAESHASIPVTGKEGDRYKVFDKVPEVTLAVAEAKARNLSESEKKSKLRIPPKLKISEGEELPPAEPPPAACGTPGRHGDPANSREPPPPVDADGRPLPGTEAQLKDGVMVDLDPVPSDSPSDPHLEQPNFARDTETNKVARPPARAGAPEAPQVDICPREVPGESGDVSPNALHSGRVSANGPISSTATRLPGSSLAAEGRVGEVIIDASAGGAETGSPTGGGKSPKQGTI